MGSHTHCCHPAAVTFPLLPQAKMVLNLATPEGWKVQLTWVEVTTQDMFTCKNRSPISEITGQCHGWELNSRPKVASPTTTPPSHLNYIRPPVCIQGFAVFLERRFIWRLASWHPWKYVGDHMFWFPKVVMFCLSISIFVHKLSNSRYFIHKKSCKLDLHKTTAPLSFFVWNDSDADTLLVG